MKKEKIIPNDNMTPSSFNKGKSRKSTTNKKSTRNSISSFNEDNLSSISNEEVLNHNEIFQNRSSVNIKNLQISSPYFFEKIKDEIKKYMIDNEFFNKSSFY